MKISGRLVCLGGDFRNFPESSSPAHAGVSPGCPQGVARDTNASKHRRDSQRIRNLGTPLSPGAAIPSARSLLTVASSLRDAASHAGSAISSKWEGPTAGMPPGCRRGLSQSLEAGAPRQGRGHSPLWPPQQLAEGATAPVWPPQQLEANRGGPSLPCLRRSHRRRPGRPAPEPSQPSQPSQARGTLRGRDRTGADAARPPPARRRRAGRTLMGIGRASAPRHCCSASNAGEQ
eukprot:gene14390-biopygen1498